jgi:hypothetical protein
VSDQTITISVDMSLPELDDIRQGAKLMHLTVDQYLVHCGLALLNQVAKEADAKSSYVAKTARRAKGTEPSIEDYAEQGYARKEDNPVSVGYVDPGMMVGTPAR